MRDRTVLCLFLVFALLAGARCWTNLPWVDEGWFFDTVYNLLRHGHTGTTVLVAKGMPWEGIERYQFWQPPGFWIFDSIWMSVFGLSLQAMRGLSVIAGLVLLYCWYWLLRRYQAPRAVLLLALGIMATDYAVVKAGSDARMDMLAATLGLAGVTLYLKYREQHFTRAVVLSQVLIACGGLTHPMGGIPYALMFAWFFLTEHDWKKLRPVHLLLAAVPYVLGATGWGLYIANDPVTFRKIFFGSNVSGRMSGFANPFLALKNEILYRYLEPFGLRSTFLVARSKLLIPVIYLGCMLLVWALPIRREKFLRPFLAMWTIAALSLVFFDAQRNGTYMIHVFPLYAVLTASLAWWLWSRAGKFGRPLIAAAIAGFLLLQAGGSLYLIARSPARLQYLPVIDFLKPHAARGERVIGSAELGFGLGFEGGVRDDEALGYYAGTHPDVIVVSPRYREWWEWARKERPELHRFIETRLREYELTLKTDTYEVYLPRAR